MVQSLIQQQPSPLIDDLTVKDSYGDGVAGLSLTAGNLHITLASIMPDHSKGDPAPLRRVVSARVVLPLMAALELNDMLTGMLSSLRAQGVIAPTPAAPIVKPPPTRAH
jgi:hypothetical protein